MRDAAAPTSRRSRRARRFVAVLAIAVSGASLWWLAAGGFPSFRAAMGGGPDRLNLLLITLDTTRADRLGAYGFAGAATPALDRLAADGVTFERAVTSAPLTLPAHTSIMTGLYPPRHGVRDNGGFIVRDETVTLAERLRDQGYRTGAFIGAYVLDSRWGLDQGFDTYADDFDLAVSDASSLAAVERPANEVADRALAWLAGVDARPFFAWVHFYDPHTPYRAPAPFGDAYAAQPYVGEIAFTDSQVGRLIAFLDDRQQLEQTVVVVVGDHGESLGDHGEGTHGFFLYEATTRVPLIIRAPPAELQRRRVPAIVRTVDVVPTVLELLAQPAIERVDGRSIVPLMAGTNRDLGLDAYSEAFYPRFHFGWSELLSLHSGDAKYIAAPRPEVYDLYADPSETRNLFDARRAEAERVMASLRSLQNAATPVPSEIDAATRRRLTALGYLAGSAQAPTAPGAVLADPKDKVELFTLMTRAQELVQRRDPQDAAEVTRLLSQVTARDPSVVDAWLMLGNERSKEGEFDAAAAHYRRALSLHPDYELAMVGLARAYRMQGRFDDALVGFRRIVARDAANTQVRFELAQTLVEAGDQAAAEAELRAVLDRDAGMALARHALGALLLERGRDDEAEREIRAAVAQRSIRMAYFHLAVLAERRGQLDAAIGAYRTETRQFPDNFRAHFNLGKLFEQRGDARSQREAYERAIHANPQFAEGHLFLAKLLLDVDGDQAVRLARRGLELAPEGEYAPLGHYLVADILNRQGRAADALREVERGRSLERRLSGRERR